MSATKKPTLGAVLRRMDEIHHLFIVNEARMSFVDSLIHNANTVRMAVKLSLWKRIAQVFSPPTYGAYELAPPKGYRWETDDELRARVRILWTVRSDKNGHTFPEPLYPHPRMENDLLVNDLPNCKCVMLSDEERNVDNFW